MSQQGIVPSSSFLFLRRHLWIVSVFFLALGLRACNLEYGLPGTVHPDEAGMLQSAARIADAPKLDLDPGFFNYPALHLYVVAAALAVDRALGEAGSPPAAGWSRRAGDAVVGRWVTTIFGLATILLVYAVGCLLGSTRMGLLAALFLAVTPFHVLDSHYLNVDIPLAFWCMFALYFLLRWLRGGTRLHFLLGAAAIGCAGATKYNGLVLLLLLAICVILRGRTGDGPIPRVRLMALGVAVSTAAFLICAPYTVLRFNEFFQTLSYEASHVQTAHWGWDLNTGGLIYKPFLYQFAAGFPFVLGFALYGMCLAGAISLIRSRKREWLPVAVAFLALLIPVGMSRVVFPRYLVPMIPLLVLPAAYVSDLALSRWRRTGRRVMALLLVTGTLTYTFAVTASQVRGLTPQTADLASEWLGKNVEPGSDVSVATIIWTMIFPIEMYKVSRFKIDDALQGRSQPEWLVVNGWYDLAFQRGKLALTPAARFLADLGSPNSRYERVRAFEARFLNEDLYGVLDPYFKNNFESPDVTIYRRRPASDPSRSAAVTPAPASKGEPAGGQTYRGALIWGHESRSFTECGSGREGWVLDGTGGTIAGVYESLAVEPYQPIHVVVRGRWRPGSPSGFAAEYPEQFEVLELRRAEREGFGCREDLAGIESIALGNEPSWKVEIRTSGILFSSLGRFDRLEFPPPERGKAPDGRSFTATREGEPPTRIEVVLSERPCVDSMSGARFSFAARVRLDADRFEGCAAEGW